jgi:hypothetical protein
MARKRSAIDKATDIIAGIIQDHLDTLPGAEAKNKRKKFHDYVVKVCRSSARGKSSRRKQTEGVHLVSRSRAKIA